MDRLPEPELMDEPSQAAAYARADFSATHDRLLDTLLSRLGPLPASGVAVDLGCGPADIAVRLARRLPDWEIDGQDGAEAMLDQGLRRIRQERLAHRVTLVRGLLGNDPLPRAAYDLIVSNSLLHHLHHPESLWRSLPALAGPGTPVAIADLRRPASRAEARALQIQHMTDAPEVLQRDFHASLLAAFTVEEVEQQLQVAGLDNLTVEAFGDRHLLVWGRLPDGQR